MKLRYRGNYVITKALQLPFGNLPFQKFNFFLDGWDELTKKADWHSVLLNPRVFPLIPSLAIICLWVYQWNSNNAHLIARLTTIRLVIDYGLHIMHTGYKSTTAHPQSQSLKC